MGFTEINGGSMRWWMADEWKFMDINVYWLYKGELLFVETRHIWIKYVVTSMWRHWIHKNCIRGNTHKSGIISGNSQVCVWSQFSQIIYVHITNHSPEVGPPGPNADHFHWSRQMSSVTQPVRARAHGTCWILHVIGCMAWHDGNSGFNTYMEVSWNRGTPKLSS